MQFEEYLRKAKATDLYLSAMWDAIKEAPVDQVTAILDAFPSEHEWWAAQLEQPATDTPPPAAGDE